MSVSSILITGLGALLLAPIVWRIADRRFDPFEPVVLFCVAWGVMFVVRPTAMLIDGNLTYSGVNISGTWRARWRLLPWEPSRFSSATSRGPGVLWHTDSPNRDESRRPVGPSRFSS